MQLSFGIHNVETVSHRSDAAVGCVPVGSTAENQRYYPTASKFRDQRPRWLETQMNGVSLGMWQPAGWETDSSHGLVLAEPTSTNNGMVAGGLLINCFVPPVDEFHISTSDTNYAWTVLDQVVKMPSHTGNDVPSARPSALTGITIRQPIICSPPAMACACW